MLWALQQQFVLFFDLKECGGEVDQGYGGEDQVMEDTKKLGVE